jgi:hypothetical protein
MVTVMTGCACQSTGANLKIYAEPLDPPCVVERYDVRSCERQEVNTLFIRWRRLSEKYSKQAEIYNGGP